MFGESNYGDFIPVMYRHYSLTPDSRRDMIFLGKKTLQCLADFWEKHAESQDRVAETAPTYKARERAEEQAKREREMAEILRGFVKEAEPKPNLFAIPVIKTGSRVTCFLENPDRYVSGVVAKIKASTTRHDDDDTVEINDATAVIRINNLLLGQQTISYALGDFTMFATEDFEYFRKHQRFFELYLNYHAKTVPEHDKVARMLRCLSDQPDPPEAA